MKESSRKDIKRDFRSGGRALLVDMYRSKETKIEDLDSLVNEYAASEPVKYVLERVEIPNRELLKDLLIDASDLLFDLDPADCVSNTFYPRDEMTSSTIITLNSSGAQASDPFLDMLSASYTTTARSGPAVTRKWINLICSNDTNKALLFTDESDYWKAVRSIRNAAAKQNVSFSCRCQLRQKDAKRDDTVDITFEVRGSVMRFVRGARVGEVTSQDVTELKAMSLSANYQPIQSYLIDIKFDRAVWNNNANLDMAVILNFAEAPKAFTAKFGGVVTVTITEEQLRTLSATITVTNGPKGSDAAIVGEQLCPLKSLLGDSSSRMKEDVIVPVQLPLREATGRRIAKLTIYRATNLICLNGRTPPNPYCTVTLLNSNKDRIKTVRKDQETSLCKRTQNPVWNTEFELQGNAGIEGVGFVMIRIKDGGFGKFEHKHLGDVLIPISTFVFGANQQETTLKLELSDKMVNKFAGKVLGEIVIHAELAPMPASGAARVMAAARGGRPAEAQSGEATINMVIRRPNEFSTWWPGLVLPETDRNGHGIKCNCNVAFSFENLLIRLRNDREISGLLAYKEVKPGPPVLLCIPWKQVSSVDKLTDSVAITTQTITRANGTNATLEVLVYPCCAAALVQLWKDRCVLSDIRAKVKTYLKGTFSGAAMSASQCLPMARTLMGGLESLLVSCSSTAAVARVHVYLGQLLQGCRRLSGGPVYDKSGIKRLVRGDCDGDKSLATIGTPGGEVSGAKVVRKVDFVVDLAVARVRDYVLCSWDQIRTPSSSGLSCIEELVNAYLSEIRSMLAVYVGSKKALALIKGQENRTLLVHFLIREDLKLDSLLRAVLTPLVVVCRPQTRFLESETTDSVITWYCSALLEETRACLAKLLDPSKKLSNSNSFPWNYETVDGLYASSLPESLQTLFTPYLDLRVPTPAVSAWEEEKDRARRVNDRVLRSIGQSLLMLSDEYRKGLQSKSWGDGSSINPQADTAFLISVANDSYRLSTISIEPFRSTSAISHVTDDVTFTLIGEFNSNGESALKHIQKVIFSSFQSRFDEFDKLWFGAADDNLVNTFAAPLSESFRLVKPTMENFYYLKLLLVCADACILRYFAMLRVKGSASGTNAKLSKPQLKRVQSDVSRWGACFIGACGNTAYEPLSAKLRYLEEMRDLLCLDYTIPLYLDLVHKIAKRYSGDGRPAMMRMLTATVNLRPDSTFRLQQAVDSICDKFKAATGEGGHVDTSDDLYVRAFGDVTDAPKKSGFKLFGGGKKEVHAKAPVAPVIQRESSLALLPDDDKDGYDDRFEVGSDNGSTVYGDSGSEFGDSYAVEIFNIQVRGLRAPSFLWSVNPYIKVVINAQKQKTRVQWSKLDADWSDFTMHFQVITSNLQTKFAQVIVYDKGSVHSKTIIGTVKVSLGDLDRRQIEGWFPLEIPTGGAIGSNTTPGNVGEVHLCIKLAKGK